MSPGGGRSSGEGGSFNLLYDLWLCYLYRREGDGAGCGVSDNHVNHVSDRLYIYDEVLAPNMSGELDDAILTNHNFKRVHRRTGVDEPLKEPSCAFICSLRGQVKAVRPCFTVRSSKVRR